MLKSLSIRNVILIEQLDITFEKGFCALTGETGAGKSILLDALGLAIGNRSSQSYIRQGADQAVVSAEFIISSNATLLAKLETHGLSGPKGVVILRRVINQDGRTRAFINDQPVSIKLLQEIGQTLIEVHGQFDQLLEATSHRDFLDSYAQTYTLKAKVAEKYRDWKNVELALRNAQESSNLSQQNEMFLQHALKELDELDIQDDEEETLTQERNRLANQAKYQKALDIAYHALTGESAADTRLYEAIRAIEKVNDSHDAGELQEILATLERANQELSEAINQLDTQRQAQEGAYSSLEQVEDRLFKLRSAARKHNCLIAQLPEKREKFRDDLQLIEDHETIINDLQKQTALHKEAYITLAQQLSEKRIESAKQLDKAVMQELPPLKLERARFETMLTKLSESHWTENGIDKVQFTVATNTGGPAGALAAIASGGERSRFMLALKVILARSGAVPSMVFDEIDNGVGGAVAYAIGERLFRLAKNVQVLVVTHSPQVAAIAQYHLRIEKYQEGSNTVTKVIPLDRVQRREEVARMLAGDTVTTEARAAADQLLLTKAS